ncbi:MAG: hypothetical protein GY945_16445 [Rhodobacteraceae bacterium]|nr:hypothetical protein [Paracoccaceae bacterium]
MGEFQVIRASSLALILGLAANPVQADGFRVRTELAGNLSWSDPASLDTFLGFQDRESLSGSVRLMWDKSVGSFRFEVHSHLAFAHGDSVAFATAAAPYQPTTPPATFFNLTGNWYSDATTTLTNRIDRLSVTYSNENLVLKAGRQAITWGSGLVFHPSDIVAPFAPDATDTSYKPGADMIYGQYLFDNGADIQAIAVPRAATADGAVDAEASTLAMRSQIQLGPVDAAIMLARDRGDNVASLGLSGPLGGASVNAEYIGWQLASGAYHPSWLVNITNFTTLGEMNLSYFGEYFHNGFGVDPGAAMDTLPTSLTKRMATGQVFLTGKDYLALGASLQVNADLSISPNAIMNIDDGSAIAGFSVNYVLGDNTNLVFNYSHPFGALGTEFGGLRIDAIPGTFAAPSQTASLQLVHFF